MNIAIVGSGISGLVAAYLLHQDHEVTLFEAADYVGGHTHTIKVEKDSMTYNVDTGFIVFNETTYPNFCKLMKTLGVQSQPTQMSFSVKSLVDGLEYNGDSLGTFFAQRKNILKPTIYKIIWDMLRFNREMENLLSRTRDEQPLAPFLTSHNYSREFLEYFILPMTSSLWSAPASEARQFPVALFARFFRNHGILNLRNRLQWRVISGGSDRYIEKLIAPFKERIRLSCPVKEVRRFEDKVEVVSQQAVECFDQVIVAVHSDQALKILSDPSDDEKDVLGAMEYQPNVVQLHTDTTVMPTLQSIWASWNYSIENEQAAATVSYDMNILQSIRSPEEFIVSLNQQKMIMPEKVIGTYHYDHPAYTPATPAAQDRHGEISGRNRTHFCGAYWGYGFHEDGVRSAMAVCRNFGREL